MGVGAPISSQHATEGMHFAIIERLDCAVGEHRLNLANTADRAQFCSLHIQSTGLPRPKTPTRLLLESCESRSAWPRISSRITVKL